MSQKSLQCGSYITVQNNQSTRVHRLNSHECNTRMDYICVSQEGTNAYWQEKIKLMLIVTGLHVKICYIWRQLKGLMDYFCQEIMMYNVNRLIPESRFFLHRNKKTWFGAFQSCRTENRTLVPMSLLDVNTRNKVTSNVHFWTSLRAWKWESTSTGEIGLSQKVASILFLEII